VGDVVNGRPVNRRRTEMDEHDRYVDALIEGEPADVSALDAILGPNELPTRVAQKLEQMYPDPWLRKHDGIPAKVLEGVEYETKREWQADVDAARARVGA
jgi:hypothetical protein